MAHNRTRLAKMKAAARRRELEGVTLPSPVHSDQLKHSSDHNSSPVPKSATWLQIFGYDSRLIYKDLLKTVVVTIFLLLMLLGLRWWQI